METETTKVAEIAKLNDEFRKVNTMNLTRGIFELHDVLGLVRAVRQFDSFNENNDPYGEHDFGTSFSFRRVYGRRRKVS
ncbi:MAG TPA: DUF3768 domain-containing protein [Candidatus Saccharibacteria bacterium]|nr:DUF3768 domain-containing protein [Candidatus Saccharibacteria bacterium]